MAKAIRSFSDSWRVYTRSRPNETRHELRTRQDEGPFELKLNSSSENNLTFVTTHWTRVLEARGDSPDAKTALSDLCAAYYNPVFAFIRSHAPGEDSARDLTQEFFSHLLARKGISSVDPQHGRFRSFLLGAVKHFLSDARDRSRRLKRGGGQRMESLEVMSQSTDTSTALQVADPKAPTPDQQFDRKWALTVLARALTDLAHELETAGKPDYFETLKPWLTGDSGNLSQADAARVLGVNEGAVKVAIHRLRRHFREVIKREVAQTLRDPAQVNEELSHLLQALA